MNISIFILLAVISFAILFLIFVVDEEESKPFGVAALGVMLIAVILVFCTIKFEKTYASYDCSVIKGITDEGDFSDDSILFVNENDEIEEKNLKQLSIRYDAIDQSYVEKEIKKFLFLKETYYTLHMVPDTIN